MTIQSIGPYPVPIMPSPEENKATPKKPQFVPIEVYSSLRKKLRKAERDLVQSRKKEKAQVANLERLTASEKKMRTKIENIRKESIHLTEKIITLKNENLKLSREIHDQQQQIQTLAKSQDQSEYYRHLYEEEKSKHQLTQVELSNLQAVHENENILHIIQRMEEFIEGGINERGELIRQLDRIRDRSVQSIRILEQEKAINLGLLKNTQINRRIAERAAIFVDVQNMFYAARQQFNGRLDFQRLLAKVSSERKLFKAIAYIVETPDINQTNFITLLTRSGYEVKSKELRTRGDGSAKGNWDMEMAMDIISLLPKLDVVVLVSGDGDFVPLVQKIKNESRVHCEIYGFEHNTAIDLKEIADSFFAIGKDLILDTAAEEK